MTTTAKHFALCPRHFILFLPYWNTLWMTLIIDYHIVKLRDYWPTIGLWMADRYLHVLYLQKTLFCSCMGFCIFRCLFINCLCIGVSKIAPTSQGKSSRERSSTTNPNVAWNQGKTLNLNPSCGEQYASISTENYAISMLDGTEIFTVNSRFSYTFTWLNQHPPPFIWTHINIEFLNSLNHHPFTIQEIKCTYVYWKYSLSLADYIDTGTL